MIKYGAAKTREEKRRANFQRQIKRLMFEMDISSKAIVNEKAGLSAGRIYKLWHSPELIRAEELDRLARLFDRYHLIFDPTMGGAEHAG